MTAFPSQPLCWSYASIESDGVQYRLRRGVTKLADIDCPVALDVPRATVTGSIKELQALRASNCQVDAWLRFGRIPLLADGILSDYRFATTPRGNFTTLPVTPTPACPRQIPHWAYPRADLL